MPDAVKRVDAHALSCLLAWLISLSVAGVASAETLWGLTTANTLVRFSSDDPGHVVLTLPITGLADGERLLAINISDVDGTFLGIGSTGRLYSVERQTGAVTPLAAQTGRIIPPSGTAFDLYLYTLNNIDYRLEVSSELGHRVETTMSGPMNQVVQDPFPAGARIVATGNLARVGRVAVDSLTDRLYRVGMPFGGPTLSELGPLGVDVSDEAGIALAIYEPSTTYAALTVGGVPGLYRLTSTGRATAVGTIGSAPITSLAADREGLQVDTAGPFARYIELIEGSSATIVLRRTGDTAAAVDYVVSTDGNDDLTISPPSVHFGVGEREKTVTVTSVDDALREGSQLQSVFVRESRATSAFSSGFLVEAIDDDNERPVLTITSPVGLGGLWPADTMTISGTVTDDRPGFVLNLRVGTSGGVGESSPLEAHGSPWTFDIALEPMGPTFLLFSVRDAENSLVSRFFVVERATNQALTLAEGVTGSFFKTDISFANPAMVDVPVTIDFLRPDGSTVPHALTVPARQRVTLDVGSIPGLEATETSAIVHDLGSLAVERTMRWDASGYGASTERASPALSTSWHFAEGSQGFFSTFLLLVNPQTTTNAATVRFLRESGGPVTRTYPLAPGSRLTIDAGAIPELVNQSFGMEVTFSQPAVAERSMYFGSSPLWTGGHASAGAPALSTTWLLAEGATGSFFETFVLAANPSNQPADVTFTFLPSTGVPVTRTKQIPPNGRLTVNIEQEDPALANSTVGTRVTSSVPIVVERSQYWPYEPDRWYEAHNSVGQTAAATAWTLAEGRSGGPEGYHTYILLANPNPFAVTASIAFLRDDGDDVVFRSATIPPASRVTISVDPSQIPQLTNARFGAHITSSAPIVVERSMYWNANGQFWAAGTNATATRQPF